MLITIRLAAVMVSLILTASCLSPQLNSAQTGFSLGSVKLAPPQATPVSLGSCLVLQDCNPERLSKAAACEPDGVQSSGAIYRICMPTGLWNGDLIIYAHGYVSPVEPVAIPEAQMMLPDGTPVADVVNFLGYAFATTSYRVNGLAIPEGVADLVDLAENVFIPAKGQPRRIYLIGISEGGLITTLAVERRPDLFTGGLAMCGPYGDFAKQVNYFGDFLVVFDQLFPGLLGLPANNPVDIPQSLIDNWDSYYSTTVKPEIENPDNAATVNQLLAATGAAYDPADETTKEQTVSGILWYNIFSTTDAMAKLGGQPFDNQTRIYLSPDHPLNQNVVRYSADPAALAKISADYQTTGRLANPLVTLHTTGDPIVPYWHVADYRQKTARGNNPALHEAIDVNRYGHCAFEAGEIFAAFARLTELVDNPPKLGLFLPLIVK